MRTQERSGQGLRKHRPKRTALKLFFRKGRLEVEDDVNLLTVCQRPDGASAQMVGNAALEPVTGEIEISLLAFDQCPVHIEMQADIFHLQTGELWVVVPRMQGRFAGESRCDRVAGLRRKPVTVTG